MFEKIKTLDYQKLIKELRDVRVIGLLVFAGIVLLVTWSGIGAIQTNYDLQKKISALEQSVDVQKLSNSNLALRNQYFETDQYLELQARRQFNRAAPGEKLLIIPRNVALAHSVETLPEASAEISETEASKPGYQKNFEAWMNFLFRRNSLNN